MEELLAMMGGSLPDDSGPDARQLRRDVDFLKAAKLFKDIPAQLTGRDATTGFYSWTWRDFGGTSNATRTDSANGVTGSPTMNPARTPNGQVIDVTSPVDCWLRPVGLDPTIGVIWEVTDGSTSRGSSSYAPTGGSLGTLALVSTLGTNFSTITITTPGVYILSTYFDGTGSPNAAALGMSTLFVSLGITGGTLQNSGVTYVVNDEGYGSFGAGNCYGSVTPTYFVNAGTNPCIVTFTATVNNSGVLPPPFRGWDFAAVGRYGLQRLS